MLCSALGHALSIAFLPLALQPCGDLLPRSRVGSRNAGMESNEPSGRSSLPKHVRSVRLASFQSPATTDKAMCNPLPEQRRMSCPTFTCSPFEMLLFLQLAGTLPDPD